MLDCREQTSDCLAVAIKSLFFFLLSPTLVSSCVVYKMNGALNEGIEQWEAVSLCCKGLRGKGWSLKTPWHPFSWLFKHQTKQLSAINIKPIFGSVETLNPHIKTAADMYRPRETYRSSKCGIVQHSAKQCKKKAAGMWKGAGQVTHETLLDVLLGWKQLRYTGTSQIATDILPKMQKQTGRGFQHWREK